MFWSLIAVSPIAARPQKAEREFEEHLGMANAAFFFGDWEDAQRRARAAAALAPDNPLPWYHVARAATWQGQVDLALDAIERSIQRGLCPAECLRGDIDLQALQDDPRFQEQLRAVLLNEDCPWSCAPWMRNDGDDRQDAPSFPSLRKLRQTYDRRSSRLDDEAWNLPWGVRSRRYSALGEERYRALSRYLRDHPTAQDREDAAWDAVLLRSLNSDLSFRARCEEEALRSQAELRGFLATFPRSKRRGEAELRLAFANWYGRPAGGSAAFPWSDADLHALEGELLRLSETHAGTTLGGRALALRIWVGKHRPDLSQNAELLTLAAQLERDYGRDREVQALVQLKRLFLRPAALASSLGTDTHGRTWDLESIRGKVTLLWHWTPGSKACNSLIPALNAAWTKYRDRGFQLLGIVRSDHSEEVAAWLQRYGIEWPHVIDDHRRPARLRDGVSVYPFPVLLDRTGGGVLTNLAEDTLDGRIEELLAEP